MVWWCGSRILVPSVGSVYAATHEALGMLQSWLAGEGTGVLVVLTHGAVGLAGEDVTDLAGAAVWGLVRSAQAEYPGRVVLVDSDGSLDIAEVIGCGEPQLVVRSGVAHAARLTPAGRAVSTLPAGAVADERRRRRHIRGSGGAFVTAGGAGARVRCGWRWVRSG